MLSIPEIFRGIKPRIFITFSLITIILLSIMARFGYQTARESYESQAVANTTRLCRLLAEKIEVKYLDYIQPNPSNHAFQYFRQILNDQKIRMELTEVFIFDSSLILYVNAGNKIAGSELEINRKEIKELEIKACAASLPFKATDDNWYLWAYYRLSSGWYLGIQENAGRLAELDKLAYTFFLIGLIGVILTFMAAAFLTRSITKPIDKLVKFSARIGEGFFDDQVPPQRHDELQTLQETLVKMRDALKEKQQEKEQILAQIAHEIRNPLGGIELIAGLMKEDLKNDRTQTGYLQKILTEIKGLKTQINDFLNYSRPAVPRLENVPLDEITNEIEEVLMDRIKSKKIQLFIEHNLQSVKFDRGHLRQIMINLISNSIDAVPEGGHIIITSGKKGKEVYIMVQDDGSGIPESVGSKIFDPFVTTKKDGAGLGLAICKKLCKENNASIYWDNKVDKGSAFVIQLNIEGNKALN
ncbi:MAG: HAMP domain-containing histidine kinase [Calditrichaceae bacterium]|nr:HAMP domain-containing histidine kinase [Calditrichaceae bacterium]MBN2708421.1 HAMP domain-containing histidine kinase [Calditrichaceae bacterium]RQV93141.1 MAG: sensor histidine kinase [Calditrichota bacterium]